jgi:hypothetical protein
VSSIYRDRTGPLDEDRGARAQNYLPEALSLFEKGPLALVAGAGFEPATSGL